MTGNREIPLDDFERDALATEADFLVDEQFAEAVAKLEPTWSSMASSLLSALRSFDEAGLLRPRLRARFSAAYAQYEYDRQFVRNDNVRAEWDEFDAIRTALHIGRRHFDDPAEIHPAQSDTVLAKYLSFANADEVVTWSEWTHTVGEYAPRPGIARPITRTSVKSFYAEWQRLRAWALLESYTLRLLIKPNDGGLERIERSRDYDLNGRWLMSTLGDGRYEFLLSLLEGDGWLTALYRSRALVNWAELRTWQPTYQLDPAASTLSVDERWNIERSRLVERCRKLVQPWVSPGDDDGHWPSTGGVEAPGPISIPFRNRVRGLLALWQRATEAGHGAFAASVREDLAAASTWAMCAFDTTFATNDTQIGELANHEKATLGLVLRPERTRSRRAVDRDAEYVSSQFNKHIAEPQLAVGDFARFLDMLEGNELWAWAIELANLFEFQKGPIDTARDRRFLHLRSLALLDEQILAILAELHGTDADRNNIGRGSAEGPLKVFLAGRPDWRHDLWTAVSTNAHLTRTNDSSVTQAVWTLQDDPPLRLTKCVQAIEALRFKESYGGAAKQLLLFWTIRNFGAHRFSRDARLLEDFGGHFAGAVIFCPLLYWKIATTMG